MSTPVALLAITDKTLRQRIGRTLTGLRWQVLEMSGGAETLSHLEATASGAPGSEQAVILDKWLPDLDISEFFKDVQSTYPDVDLISVDGSMSSRHVASTSRRGELMHAIRTSLEGDGIDTRALTNAHTSSRTFVSDNPAADSFEEAAISSAVPLVREAAKSHDIVSIRNQVSGTTKIEPLSEFIGTHPAILEVSRRIRLVAPRLTSVLIQGQSGTGKELVARATHRLSKRSAKPFIVLNCAAIPESLLEAELFGHTRGAFTGAVQGRVGRIEAAHGGTLFLDEIGELPLSLQSKLLRFLESGEIQRVGDNDTHIVDVRIVAATHQHLAARSRQGTFRGDLFHRLAVFTIRTPPLNEHAEDIPLMADIFLRRLCEGLPAKHLDAQALELLLRHDWPGNVRELAHVIERAVILAENRMLIRAGEIEFDHTADL